MKQDWFSILKNMGIKEFDYNYMDHPLRIDMNLMINDFLGKYFIEKSDLETQKSEQETVINLIDVYCEKYKLSIRREEPNTYSDKIIMEIVPCNNSINEQKTFDKQIIVYDFVYSCVRSIKDDLGEISINSQVVSHKDDNIYVEEKNMKVDFSSKGEIQRKNSQFKRVSYLDVDKLKFIGIDINDFDGIDSLREGLGKENVIPDINVELRVSDNSYAHNLGIDINLKDLNTSEDFKNNIFEREYSARPHMHLYYKYLRSLKKVKKVKILK